MLRLNSGTVHVGLWRLVMCTAGLLLTGISAAEGADEIACTTEVTSISNLARMSEGDFSANGHWADVTLKPTSIGYGPAANHEYELTILDGTVYMARPDGDRILVRHDPRADEGFAMLQLASPKAWVDYGELSQIGSFDDLNFELDQVVEDLECGDQVLLPFMIQGHASSVTWSMDTAPENRVTTTKDQDVTIIGLYNRIQKQTYFMVRGYNLHAHVVFPALDQAGHLRSLRLDEGAHLYLPTK